MALSAGDAAAALSAALHLPAGRFSVHCTQPDHFLIVFANSGDRDLALSRSPIPAPPYQLILRPWTRLVTATSFSMPFRVSLDLEGIPAHAWNTSSAAALVAPGRFISVDTPARPDEYRFLRVTISSHNPAAIPKTRLLLIPELTLGSQCLLRYRVLLHVRSVVCLSAPSASGDVDPAGGGGASGEGGGAANDGGGDLGARSSRAPAAAAAVPPPVAARQPAQDGDWQSGRRQCRRRPRQRRPGASVKPSSPETRTGIPPELQDRCLDCLSSAHRIATCRLPVRCRRCMGLNHLARDCKRPRSPSSPSERQGGRRVLPRRAASPSDATPSASQASTPVGSPVAALAPSPPPLCFSASPIRSEDESLCVVERSPQLKEEEGRLRRALFARVSGLDMALSAGDAAAALSAALHLPAGRFSVHCAQPDHFLIVFANSGDMDLALSRSPIPAPPYQLILRPWTRLVMATSFSMPFRVSLDLEGVPAHAWNASTAAALVAPGRLISVDTPARPDEYRFLRVTISSHNPAAIPKARLLLIPEPTLGSQCLLRYRVLLHVLSVVCLSAPSASGDVDPAGGGGASGEGGGAANDGGGAANDGGGDLGARSSRAHAATSFSPLADDGRGLLLALPDATNSPAAADAITASPVDVVPPVDAGSPAADVATTCSPVAAGMPAAAVAAAGSTAPAVVAPDSPVAAVAVFSSPTVVAASSSPAASPVDIVAASSSPAAAVAAFGSPTVVVASNSLVAGSLAAVVSPVCATSPVAACHPPTASSLLSGPSGGGPAFPASPLCSRRSPLLADGIAASYAEPTGLFFDELDALAAEFGPAVPLPPRVSPVPPSASGAGTSLPRTACTPPTGGEWLRPESPLPQQAPTLVVDVPDGVLYDVPMVVLDLDGRPLAHSLPSSVADNAALRAFLTSCSRPLPPALLSPPLPLPPLAAKAVEVVPKRSERIAAKMALEALEGPIHAVSRAQRNLMRKLGLVPERGPVTTEAVAAYNALFSKPLS
ncbi:hypothetical protein OsI_24675 [Oryza sativa Indica Group]|uniref:CCHC-type domain-containing protein n=1 Tax=Oryza sativa subsp. indica TaxID=39946 RepID=B8B6S3_ORYSI|nr:hypothetical protein OsI_24675 [Oryza sativa Indica Group]